MSDLKGELKAVKQSVKKGEHRITVLKGMSRTYWERWRWELEKRKEAMITNSRVSSHKHSLHPVVHEVDPSLLTDPVVNEKRQEHYLGRGSFGVVRLQLYRGIYVAVKELLPKSVKEDVKHEAEILATLCHPFLPQLFGICTRTQPLRISPIAPAPLTPGAVPKIETPRGENLLPEPVIPATPASVEA